MDANTFSPTMAALSSSSAHAGNRNLSTDPRRMAVIKVWAAMMRGARKYCEQEGFMTVHNMPHIVGVTGACENTDTLFALDWYDGKKMFLPQSNQLCIEMLTQAVEGGRVCGEIQRFRKELALFGCDVAAGSGWLLTLVLEAGILRRKGNAGLEKLLAYHSKI